MHDLEESLFQEVLYALAGGQNLGLIEAQDINGFQHFKRDLGADRVKGVS